MYISHKSINILFIYNLESDILFYIDFQIFYIFKLCSACTWCTGLRDHRSVCVICVKGWNSTFVVSERRETRSTVFCKIDSWSRPSQRPQNSRSSDLTKRYGISKTGCESQLPESGKADRNSVTALFLSLPFLVLLVTIRTFSPQSPLPLTHWKTHLSLHECPRVADKPDRGYPDEYKSNSCTDVLSKLYF